MPQSISKPIYVINGPNLNLLGKREPEIYGAKTLTEIAEECAGIASKNDISVEFLQNNTEGELVNYIHEAEKSAAGIILNAGAYTHTSIALHDAIKGGSIPVIELHISNIHKREEFRHKSLLAGACIGQICGFGTYGYSLALLAMLNHLSS